MAAGLGVAFLLLSATPAPLPAQVDAQRTEEESGRRFDFLRGTIDRLVALDNDLVSAGKDDPVRERRINRLFLLKRAGLPSRFDSLAVAAAMFDLLVLDPDVTRSPLGEDVAEAAGYALAALPALVPSTRLPMSARWMDERLSADRRPPATPPRLDIGVAPVLSPGVTAPAPVIVETGAVQTLDLAGGPCRGFRWVPGSHRLVMWDDRELWLIDADTPGDRRRLGELDAATRPDASSSGEYVAWVRPGLSDGRGDLVVSRITGVDAPRPIAAGARLQSPSFSPRDLRVIWWQDGRIRLLDLADPKGVPTPVGAAAPGSSLEWSPDGGRILDISSRPEDPGQAVIQVHPPDSTGAVARRTVPAADWWWDPSSRSVGTLSVIAGRLSWVRVRLQPAPGAGNGKHGAEDRLALAEPETAAVLPVPAGVTASGARWSPDGRRLGCELSVAPPARLPAEGIDPDATSLLRSAVTVVDIPRPTTEGIDPANPVSQTIAWHPRARWYAAVRRLEDGHTELWLHDAVRHDAFPLAGDGADWPAFSSDGRRVAWLAPAPGTVGVAVTETADRPADILKARQEAALGAPALEQGHPAEAVRRFRNAIRLSPTDARFYQGLGRAYLAIADSSALGLDRTRYVEGAARELAVAAELGWQDSGIRVDFLDAMARRAVLVGRINGRRLIGETLAELDRLTPSQMKGPAGRALEQKLVDGVIWDPWNQLGRMLLAGFPEPEPPEKR